MHLSKKEQCRRFIERLEHKEKHWKFSSADIAERNYWKKYEDAYEQAIKATSTKIAPWYIVPADHKPYAHYIISKIILERIRELNPTFPSIDKKERAIIKQEKKKLLMEIKN